MSYLLDTHILLWWISNDPRLDAACRAIINDPQNRIFVSSASAWEIATKYRVGKLPQLLELKYHDLRDATRELGSVAVIREVFIGFQRYLYFQDDAA